MKYYYLYCKLIFWEVLHFINEKINIPKEGDINSFYKWYKTMKNVKHAHEELVHYLDTLIELQEIKIIGQ